MSEEMASGRATAAEPVVSALRDGIPDALIHNPVQWYYHRDRDSEWWHRGGTREEATAKGRVDYEGEAFWISECKSMMPNFAIFDAGDICERLSEDDEAWGEDGWTGEPNATAMRELERRLEATFKAWFAEFATLSGASLDELRYEHVPAQGIEARSGGTETGPPEGESPVRALAEQDKP